MRTTLIEAVDIPDAWFQCVDRVQEAGDRYVVQHGSYIGQTRLEFYYIVVTIGLAYKEPYDLMLPQIPDHRLVSDLFPASINRIRSHVGMPNPVLPGYIEEYLPYLMSDHIEPGEQYAYGSRIHGQVHHWCNVLAKTPNTNQAVLQVARPEDCELEHPPCLRHIDIRVKNKTLIFYPYFRSWDLWNGFPANLAGIAVLQQYMADLIGVGVGPIVAASKGLHLYGYAEELARLRTGKQ